MLASWDATHSVGSDIVIYVDGLDLRLTDYRTILEERDWVAAPRKYLSEIYNEMVAEREYEYYQLINDDHIYRTKHWDDKMIRTIERRGGGWGVAAPSDVMTDDNWATHWHPSAEIVSGNIFRALGYAVPPSIRHYSVDDYMRDIGAGIGRLFYCPEIVIKHDHVTTRGRWDANAEFVYRQDRAVSRLAYEQWRDGARATDIDKVKTAMIAAGVTPPSNEETASIFETISLLPHEIWESRRAV